MKTRYLLATLPVAIAAIAIVWAHTRGGYQDGVGSVAFIPSETAIPKPTITPTPLFGWQSCILSHQVAHSAEDAVSCAREHYAACPPYCALSSIVSLQYVETTVGGLRRLLQGTATGNLGGTDDTEVWAIVAHGTFQGWAMGLATHEYHVGSNFWVFVLKDQYGNAAFATDDTYDISRLGKVHEVPLPLPEWPTPVSLTPIEG